MTDKHASYALRVTVTMITSRDQASRVQVERVAMMGLILVSNMQAAFVRWRTQWLVNGHNKGNNGTVYDDGVSVWKTLPFRHCPY